MLNRAIAVLAADLRTEHLAIELGRQHNTAGNLLISGLRWFRAANTLQSAAYTDSQRSSWAYFVGIASKIGEDERVERTPPRRETIGERRHRELKAQVEVMKARDRARAEQEALRNGSH